MVRQTQSGDSVHVGVGSALLAVGSAVVVAMIIAVGTSETPGWSAIWFWVVAVPFGLITSLGAYMLLAVYVPWLPLPQTRLERHLRPSLAITEITSSAENIFDVPVLRIGLVNTGNSDLKVNSNILVPEWVVGFQECHQDGASTVESRVLTTSESLIDDDAGNPVPSIYWNHVGLTCPARTAVPLFFRLQHDTTNVTIPIKAKFWSSDLDQPLEVTTDVDG